MTEVAAAGDCGCSRTTAKFISPGHAQPSPAQPEAEHHARDQHRVAAQGEQRQPARADDQLADALDHPAGRDRGERAHTEVDGDRDAELGRGERERLADLDREPADEEPGEHHRDRGGKHSGDRARAEMDLGHVGKC
ncbi:hypothetical protein ACIA8K_07795 [Catenuloplanes sp. NPDC051500]|uniref:hypothetical protein n=1 Tax=Catenuloplanes sp. NPDC051500 TaxID=3363959 RepID=UPI0037AABCC2